MVEKEDAPFIKFTGFIPEEPKIYSPEELENVYKASSIYWQDKYMELKQKLLETLSEIK